MTINVNGVSLFYKTLGSGFPLLLLHGNGEDHSIFNEIADKLKNHFTIYAIDSRNHGNSAKTDDFSYETMSEDIYAFINALSLGKANIIGFSDGAIISLILAMNHSDCIEKMALLGANLKPENFTEESYQYIKSTYEETKDPLFKLMLEQPNIEVDDIKRIDIPTLVIGADNDIFKPDTFSIISNTLPDARLKVMVGHGHDSYISHNDMLFDDFVNFFS